MKTKRNKGTRKITALLSAMMISGQFASTSAVIYAHAEGEATKDYSVEQNVSSSWDGGCCAEIVLTNLADTETQDWEITFTTTDKISSLWNGSITGMIALEESYQYTVEAMDYNRVITSGQSVTIGYIGEGNYHDFIDIKAEMSYATNENNFTESEQKAEAETDQTVEDTEIGIENRSEQQMSENNNSELETEAGNGDEIGEESEDGIAVDPEMIHDGRTRIRVTDPKGNLLVNAAVEIRGIGKRYYFTKIPHTDVCDCVDNQVYGEANTDEYGIATFDLEPGEYYYYIITDGWSGTQLFAVSEEGTFVDAKVEILGDTYITFAYFQVEEWDPDNNEGARIFPTTRLELYAGWDDELTEVLQTSTAYVNVPYGMIPNEGDFLYIKEGAYTIRAVSEGYKEEITHVIYNAKNVQDRFIKIYLERLEKESPMTYPIPNGMLFENNRND